jgi:DMSO/TMAO reductase YedYZ molybdopterin-dependent catalytic subunit
MSHSITRRDWMRSSVAAAAAALLSRGPAVFGFADAAEDEEVIPFLNRQPDMRGSQLQWDRLTPAQWTTPTKNLYHVSHYGTPKVEAEGWKLSFGGLVEKPLSLTLDEIKARPRRQTMATLECGGNGMNPGFMGAVGNCTWAGTPLAPLLKEAGIKPSAVEAAFWGADRKVEKIRNMEFEQNFARTLSIPEALREDILLCYELNGEPLTQGHGFPLRLVVPGWYGIAWVKWLNHIELSDRRLMTRFIARDYVTIYGEKQGDQTVWKERSVGPLNVKSIVARVVRRKNGTLLVNGAAWTQGRIKSVELKIDDGAWQQVPIERREGQPEHTWVLWTHEWKGAKEGEHTIVSRATDEQGRVQPSPEDPAIALKKTNWEANQQHVWKIRV